MNYCRYGINSLFTATLSPGSEGRFSRFWRRVRNRLCCTSNGTVAPAPAATPQELAARRDARRLLAEVRRLQTSDLDVTRRPGAPNRVQDPGLEELRLAQRLNIVPMLVTLAWAAAGGNPRPEQQTAVTVGCGYVSPIDELSSLRR